MDLKYPVPEISRVAKEKEAANLYGKRWQ